MKKVFIFEIKKLLIPLAIYLGIMSIIGFTIVITANGVYWTSFSFLYGFFSLFLMIGVIYLVFSYNKKRISADMTYSLPVTKRGLFVGKYLASIASILSMMFIYMLLCLIIFALARTHDVHYYNQQFGEELGNFVLGCFIHMAVSIPLFNFLLLFYYKANTVLDGIAFVVIGFGLLQMVMLIILNLAEVSGVPVFPFLIYVNVPIYFLETPYSLYYGNRLVAFRSVFSVYVILGTLLLIYLIWFSKKDCSIRTQGICNGIFGYKVFLPLLGVLIPILAVLDMGWDSFEWIWFILTAVGLFIGYCIYHRTVKFSKISYIVYGATLGFDFVFLILSLAR